jgi:FKBP-type peptidyl-prolyl cis-trans isomerase
MRFPAPSRGRTFVIFGTAAMLIAALPASYAQQDGASASASAPAKTPAAGKSAAPAPDAGEKSATSYSLGLIMGSQLHSGGVRPEQVSSERLLAGFHDGITGKAKLSPTDQANINKLLRSAFEHLGDDNHRAAAKFLAANGKKPDVVTTASGLQYKVINAGSGDSPKPTDSATVNYRGTLPDGTEFDSSYKRNEPATFPVNRVIPGWTEALQLMKPGAKFTLWIPPQLAYDLRPPQNSPIPPGSMLVFDVELISVKPAAAAAAPGALPQPNTPTPTPPPTGKK